MADRDYIFVWRKASFYNCFLQVEDMANVLDNINVDDKKFN